MTCNIHPRILDVAVSYNATGYLTFEPLWRTSTYPQINFTSTVISTVMPALEYHLSNAQAPDTNIAVEGIYDLYHEYTLWKLKIDPCHRTCVIICCRLMTPVNCPGRQSRRIYPKCSCFEAQPIQSTNCLLWRLLCQSCFPPSPSSCSHFTGHGLCIGQIATCLSIQRPLFTWSLRAV